MGIPDERNSEEQEDEPKSLPSSPAKMIPKDAEKAEAEEPKLQTLPHWIYLLIMLVIVVVAVIVISCDLPTVDVIQVAQVFNGCLLPFFSICLLLCLNDPQFMGKRPQRWWCNIFLIVSVTITLFLASNVVMHNVFSGIITREEIKFGIAGAIAFTVMATLMIATSLGKEVAASFSKKSLVDEAVQVEMKTST